jgi:hypothetical protein
MAFPCFFHRQSAGWSKGEGVSGVIILVPRSFASPGQSLEISVNNCRTKIINQRFPAQAPIFIHTHIYIYIYLFIYNNIHPNLVSFCISLLAVENAGRKHPGFQMFPGSFAAFAMSTLQVPSRHHLAPAVSWSLSWSAIELIWFSPGHLRYP